MIRVSINQPFSDSIGGLTFRDGVAELDKMPSYAALAAAERLVGEGNVRVDEVPDADPPKAPPKAPPKSKK